MWAFDSACEALDNVWHSLDDAGLFDVPFIGSILSAIIDFFWGLFDCEIR